MSGYTVLDSGIFSIRESDGHPIVTTIDGRVWLVSSDSFEMIDNKGVKEGDLVEIFNRESERGWPEPNKRTDDYCAINCPSCNRHYAHRGQPCELLYTKQELIEYSNWYIKNVGRFTDDELANNQGKYFDIYKHKE